MSVKKKTTPFSISPNPNSLFLTSALEAVLFRARFTVDNRQGLTVILGDNGLGKSTLIRYLHAEYDARDDVISLLIPTPSFKSEYAMIQTICSTVGLPSRRSVLAHQQELETWLGEQYLADKNVVLWIDEAQALTNKMLEVFRGLLNFETETEKLIQIVMAGQLELRDRLLTDKLKPFKSRLVAPSILSPLTPEDVAGMLAYRCEYWKVANPFTSETIDALYTITGGLPRATLSLCAVAFEMMKLSGAKTISPDLIGVASRETDISATAEEAAA